MTRDERNRAISEIREPLASLAVIPHVRCSPTCDANHDAFPDISPLGVWILKTRPEWHWEAADWHSDILWPTLLREMPEPELWLESSKAESRLYGCVVDLDDDSSRHGGYGSDPADAVCDAWLHWKEHGRTT